MRRNPKQQQVKASQWVRAASKGCVAGVGHAPGWQAGQRERKMALASWMLSSVEAGRAKSEFADVDGARMHYLTAGSGFPLILIHGIIGSAYSWRNNILPLAKNSTVYALDLLGLGESERVAGLDATMSATAGRLTRFMDAVGVEKADIVATSHGGAVAMMLAALYPDRVRKLILVAPANPFSDTADAIVRFYQTALGKWFVPHVPFLPEPLQEVALGRMYGDPHRVAPGTVGNYVAALRVPGTAQHVAGILENWFVDMAELAKDLPKLAEKPMLLLWGDRDRAVSVKSASRLMRTLHRARLRVFKGMGHLPYEEIPEEFNGAVMAWLAKSPKDGKAKGPGLRLVDPPLRSAA